MMSAYREDNLADANPVDQAVNAESGGFMQSVYNFRPAAVAADFMLSPLQKGLGLVRFLGACCTTNMSPYFEVGRPFGDIVNWALVNPSLYFGKMLYDLVSKHPQDNIDNVRSQGRGNFALGCLVLLTKVVLANIPCALIGVGFGFLPPFVNPVFARVIAAAVAPWIYIAVEKLLLDRVFPPAQMKKTTQAPPLYFLQYVGLLGFTIYDATKLWMFAHIILREFKDNAGVAAALSNPLILAGVLPLYMIINYLLDPYIFGPRPLNPPPPFEMRVTADEVLQPHHEERKPLLDGDDPSEVHIPNEFDDIPENIGGLPIGTAEEVRCDKAKAYAIYAACAVIAMGAGIAADFAAANLVVGDPEALTDTAWQATVAIPCAVMALTYLGLTNAAPWVIRKTSSCWASYFHPEPDDTVTEVAPLLVDVHEVEPLLVKVDVAEHPLPGKSPELHRPPPPAHAPSLPAMNDNNRPAPPARKPSAPVLPMPAAVQQPASTSWYSSTMTFFSDAFSTHTTQVADLAYPAPH